LADHYYSSPPAGAFVVSPLSAVTVATSPTAGNPLEFRITDASVTREQAVQFLERMADYFTVNPIVGGVAG
jgi:hypothetical protein